MSVYLTLRPIRGNEDIEYNLNLLAAALMSFNGAWVQPGSITRQALRDDLVVQGGPVQASGLTVGGTPAATTTQVAAAVDAALTDYATSAEAAAALAEALSDYYTAAQVDAALPDAATTSVLGLVHQATAVADLDQTISEPPTQAEVQAISDKVDALLAALRTAGVVDE